MRFFKLLSVGCLSLISVASHAENLNSLYQVLEPVSSQAPQERDQATLRALDTLVLRLTGDAKAAQNPGLAAIRKDPHHSSIWLRRRAAGKPQGGFRSSEH